jgi:PAS domain-containing protein
VIEKQLTGILGDEVVANVEPRMVQVSLSVWNALDQEACVSSQSMPTETQGARTFDPLDLRNLIETMPAPVVCALPDSSVEFANRPWLEYTGCSLQHLTGWVWQSTIHPVMSHENILAYGPLSFANAAAAS